MSSGERGLVCKSCGSATLRKFKAKTGIHFPGLRNIDKPAVWVSADLFVCLNCGTAEFAVPEDELHQLEEGGTATAG